MRAIALQPKKSSLLQYKAIKFTWFTPSIGKLHHSTMINRVCTMHTILTSHLGDPWYSFVSLKPIAWLLENIFKNTGDYEPIWRCKREWGSIWKSSALSANYFLKKTSSEMSISREYDLLQEFHTRSGYQLQEQIWITWTNFRLGESGSYLAFWSEKNFLKIGYGY